MKIDIHTHTKKCKSGDAPTREISPKDFCKAILSTEVRIIAITNHNVFDLYQFTEIVTSLGKDAQVWPGIEFDIVEDGSRGHLLVIVSPNLAKGFSETVEEFTKESNPDSFTTTIDEVLEKFDSFEPLYVAHYRQKKPDLSDSTIAKLLAGTKNPGRVIKEVTNAISAGIYISHGHASIYGSDVQDWAKYEELSRELPDLRLPVDSFEQFCLLLVKDPTTINTALDQKNADDLELSLFDDDTTIKFRAYNDINVVFGPKGTGKTCILNAIAKHYTANGKNASVYESASGRLDEIFDTKGNDLTIDLNDFSIKYCTNEIKALRDAVGVDVTSLTKYVAYFEAKTPNENAKKMLLRNIDTEEDSVAKREFVDFNKTVKKTKDFLEFLAKNSSVEKVLTEHEHKDVIRILSDLFDRLSERQWSSFSD